MAVSIGLHPGLQRMNRKLQWMAPLKLAQPFSVERCKPPLPGNETQRTVRSLASSHEKGLNSLNSQVSSNDIEDLALGPLNNNIVLWSNGDGTCLTNRKRWFDSIIPAIRMTVRLSIVDCISIPAKCGLAPFKSPRLSADREVAAS